MSYRNPMHGLDADGEREVSVGGATLPDVSADHSGQDAPRKCCDSTTDVGHDFTCPTMTGDGRDWSPSTIDQWDGPRHLDGEPDRGYTADDLRVQEDDAKRSGFPAHIPVRPSGKCSIMCDHPDIDREESHEAAVRSWRAEPAFEILPPIVVDMWEINQRELERRVAAGEALPGGVTPEQVAAWRAERGPGEAVTTGG